MKLPWMILAPAHTDKKTTADGMKATRAFFYQRSFIVLVSVTKLQDARHIRIL